jgi:hypothetical protein
MIDYTGAGLYMNWTGLGVDAPNTTLVRNLAMASNKCLRRIAIRMIPTPYDDISNMPQRHELLCFLNDQLKVVGKLESIQPWGSSGSEDWFWEHENEDLLHTKYWYGL